MNTAIIKKFAQNARRVLLEQIARKLELVLAPTGIYRRENEAAVKELEREIKENGAESVIKKAAYTWFNRLCALRFMDVKGYTRVRVISPATGLSQPEILTEAKAGHIDEVLIPDAIRQRVIQLLSRQTSSENPEQEAFSLLFTACCNYYHREMPFLFEKIQDYTELLMPDGLLSENSVMQMTIAALDEANCEKVEVIGWLYQYYISERKDEVFADLKKNKKIQQADIPAATQLFTPEWIVRYMVENSLGRLWLQNFPRSGLQKKMSYYIPDEPEATSEGKFIKISSPEEIRFCDPACGSGHILVIAFDLLYQMYEEHGYDSTQIPALILQKNLVGLEIDERAAELAAFALSMKAREKDSRFFSRKDAAGNKVVPEIHTFQNVKFSEDELQTILATGITMKALQTLEQNQTPEVSPYWQKINRLNEKNEKDKLQKLEKEFARKEEPDEKSVKAIEKARENFEKNRLLDPDLFANFINAIKHLTDFDSVLSLFKKLKLDKNDELKRVYSENSCFESFFSDFLNSLKLVKNYLVNLGEMKTFGSLILPVEEAHALMAQSKKHIDKFLAAESFRKIDMADIQKDYLSRQFQVVVANPPYMGGKGMNSVLAAFLKTEYPDYKSDLFSAFIYRNTFLTKPCGFLGFMTPFVWMFISSYEKLRLYLINEKTITSLIQLEYSGFEGATVPICTFTLQNAFRPDYLGGYVRLSDFRGAAIQGPMALEIIRSANHNSKE